MMGNQWLWLGAVEKTIKTARDNGRFALRLEASATGHGLKAY